MWAQKWWQFAGVSKVGTENWRFARVTFWLRVSLLFIQHSRNDQCHSTEDALDPTISLPRSPVIRHSKETSFFIPRSQIMLSSLSPHAQDRRRGSGIVIAMPGADYHCHVSVPMSLSLSFSSADCHCSGTLCRFDVVSHLADYTRVLRSQCIAVRLTDRVVVAALRPLACWRTLVELPPPAIAKSLDIPA
jgi:hypothetical protein